MSERPEFKVGERWRQTITHEGVVRDVDDPYVTLGSSKGTGCTIVEIRGHGVTWEKVADAPQRGGA